MNSPIGDNTYWLSIKQGQSQKKLELAQHFFDVGFPVADLTTKV